MWTEEQRKMYRRPGGGYPSDMTEAEWPVLGPLIPDANALRLEIVRRNPEAIASTSSSDAGL